MRSFSRLFASGAVVLVLFLLPSGASAGRRQAPPTPVPQAEGDLSGILRAWLAAFFELHAPRAAAPSGMERSWAKAGSSMDPNGTVIIIPPGPGGTPTGTGIMAPPPVSTP